jgi:flagellar hook-length control protein FliK
MGQTPGQAPTDPTASAQGAPAPQADTTNGAPRTPTFSPPVTAEAAGSSGAQSGSGAAKASADIAQTTTAFVPVAAATAPTVAIAAPATAATADAVPVSGLAVAIASRARAGSNQFDIRLDPPELGRIDVRLDVNRDGQVTSHVTADRQDTLDLLQQQQPQLERALEQAGLKTADNGLQFSLRDQSFTGQNTGQNNSGSGHTNAQAQLVIPDADLPPVNTTQIYYRAGLGSGLDIRV